MIFYVALAAIIGGAIVLKKRATHADAGTLAAPERSTTAVPDSTAYQAPPQVAPTIVPTSPTPPQVTLIQGTGVPITDMGDGTLGVAIGVDRPARLADAATLTWIQQTTPPPEKGYRMGHFTLLTMAQASPSEITDPNDPKWGNGQSYNEYVQWIQDKNAEADRFNAEEDERYARELEQWQTLQRMVPL